MSRSRVLPQPCGPYTPVVRSNGTHNGPVRGTFPTPRRQPTVAGANEERTLVVPDRCASPTGERWVCSADRGALARRGHPLYRRRFPRPYRSGRISVRTRRSRPTPRTVSASPRLAMPARRPGPTIVHSRAAQMVPASSSSSRTTATGYTTAAGGAACASGSPTPTWPVSRPPRPGNSSRGSGQAHPRPVSTPAAPWAASRVTAARHSQASAAAAGTSQLNGNGSGRRRTTLLGLIPR